MGIVQQLEMLHTLLQTTAPLCRAAQNSTVFIKANCLFECQLHCLLLCSVQLFSSLSYLRDTGVLKKITVCYHYGCYNQQDNRVLEVRQTTRAIKSLRPFSAQKASLPWILSSTCSNLRTSLPKSSNIFLIHQYLR